MTVDVIPAVDEFVHGDFSLSGPEGMFEGPAKGRGPIVEEVAHFAAAPVGGIGLEARDALHHVERGGIGGGIGRGQTFPRRR